MTVNYFGYHFGDKTYNHFNTGPNIKVFKSWLETQTFNTRIGFNHLNTEHVCFADPH